MLSSHHLKELKEDEVAFFPKGLLQDFFVELFLKLVVIGLSIGAIYALIALGYTMVYGIIELIKIAHGDIFMMGTLVSWLG
jgi:hypothetical protein